MCESYPEQRPLLCDDLSDEEVKIQKSSPRCQRRIRNPVYSGRVKSQLKGAAAVITQWPEHLSSLLAYWWAGLGMIAVTIFIIYNCFSVIGTITPMSAMHISVLPEDVINTTFEPECLNIFMHVIAKEHDEVQLGNYLPYIKIMAKKHRNFKFNFIVIINDIAHEIHKELNEKDYNEMAWNSLWCERRKYDKKNWIENISIRHISLTNYLDESPLKKHWRRLPLKFFEFLVRCVAIWETGGIAFNPIILTPQSPSPIYMEKLQYILKKYNKHFNHKYNENKMKKSITSRSKSKLKVNNIRDIIKAFENEDIEQNIPQYNLTEAENRETKYTKVNKRETQHIEKSDIYNHNDTVKKKGKRQIIDQNSTKTLINGIIFGISKKSSTKNISKYDNDYNNSTEKNSSTDKNNNSLLPMFLKYLFHEDVKETNLTQDSTLHNLQANKSYNKYNSSDSQKDSVVKQIMHTFITSTIKSIENPPVELINMNKPVNNINEHFTELTIDLKGIFIATKSPCHAFIGTIFSNISRYSGIENVTEYIIAELSLFCKGLLSSCKGVDIILS